MTETTHDSDLNSESRVNDSPSTEVNTGAQPSNLEDTGFRYGEGAPAYLQGKTASEAIDFVNNLVSEAQQLYQIANTQQQQQQPQQQVQPQMNTDPDLWLTDPEKAQEAHTRQIMNQVQNYIGQAAQPLLQSNAQTARHLAEREHREVFNKWGHEVDALVANVPLAQRNAAVYNQAVKMIQANHLDELAQERAQKLMQSGTGLETGGSRGDPFAVVDNDGNDVWAKFDESDVGRAIMRRMSKRQVTELCEKSGMTVEEYAEMVAQNKARINPDKGTISNDQVRSW